MNPAFRKDAKLLLRFFFLFFLHFFSFGQPVFYCKKTGAGKLPGASFIAFKSVA
jgi:hypothetical protein